jgi:anti-anti-sigma factor
MLKYSVEQMNNIRIIIMEGQVAVNERNTLKKILENEKDVKEVFYILNLSQVFYIDSFGISFLQNLILGNDNRRKLIIVSEKEYINYVIRFNKLDKLMNVKFVGSISDAVRLFESMG